MIAPMRCWSAQGEEDIPGFIRAGAKSYAYFMKIVAIITIGQ